MGKNTEHVLRNRRDLGKSTLRVLPRYQACKGVFSWVSSLGVLPGYNTKPSKGVFSWVSTLGVLPGYYVKPSQAVFSWISTLGVLPGYI